MEYAQTAFQGEEVADKATLVDTVLARRRDSPQSVTFRRRGTNGWTDVTAHTFADDVDAVAKGLIASGIDIGDRVALLSSTRYEWTLLDYALWRVGAVTVAIYETSSPDQVRFILDNSGARMMIIETPALRDLHTGAITSVASVTETLVIDAPDPAQSAVALLTERGRDVGDEQLEQRLSNTVADSPATLIYTSGTTGTPKGVELTHRNLLAECRCVEETLDTVMVEGESTLLFLPLAHVFARTVQVGCVEGGIVLGHTNDLASLLPDLAEFRPSYLLSVPRVFEKVYNSATQRAEDDGKGAIFDRASDTAIEYSRALESGTIGFGLRARHALFDRIVYRKLRSVLGGRCTSAISGGAPLGERLGHFFRGIGVPIYEGYGLTETAAAVTVNSEVAQRIGSVGRPVDGAAVRIDDDGEIIVNGPMVFGGYWRNSEATREALQDGWFRTGDIGKLDDDGFLWITGRKKELIVTAGGKNVAPAPLEDSIRAHPLVSQCLVVGDNRPFVAALITLDAEALPGWLDRHGRAEQTPAALVTDDPDLRAEIDTAIAEANAAVSHAEAIKRYTILPEDFTLERGHMTPTLKLRRMAIHQDFAGAIDRLYH